MKTKRLLLVATLVFLLGQIDLNATETAKFVDARENLVNEISLLVNNTPVDLFSDNSNANRLTITFKVSEIGELTSLEVDGENDTLAQFVKLKIKQKSFEIYPELAGIKFIIPVSYKVF